MGMVYAMGLLLVWFIFSIKFKYAKKQKGIRGVKKWEDKDINRVALPSFASTL